jgi:alkaline phosphatase
VRLAKRILVGVFVLGIAFTAGAITATIANTPLPMLGLGGGPAAPSESLGGGQPGPSSSSLSTGPSPSPSPAAEDVGVLVGAGDISACDRYEDSLTADLVEAIPGIVFTLGDNANEGGTAGDFEECYGPSWGRPSIKERTRPTIGDNEYQAFGAKDYFRYFGKAAGPADKGYYAYDAGAWRVYVLNSNCSKVGGCGRGSAQWQWLSEDLTATARRCVLAMWHHPLFTSGPHRGAASMVDVAKLLYDADAELVLSGSVHAYERFAAQDPEGKPDPERGLVHIVAGTGGAKPVTFASPAPNSLVRASGVFGVLYLELRPDSYRFEFREVAGPAFTDAGEGECR